jgi:hypothetical protein
MGLPGSDAQFNGAAAGGDLAGTYPDPVVKDGSVTTSKLAPAEAWHEVGSAGEPAFAAGWVNYGSGPACLNNRPCNTAAFYKDPYGVVHLKGIIKSGNLNFSAFTLPEGYRPAALEVQPTISNDQLGILKIGADGYFDPFSGSNAWFSLDGVTFRAAN